MDIRRITLTNFMSHDSAELLLPPTGVTLITGPNGSGKSSYIEAVAAAFWNRSIRKVGSRKSRGYRAGGSMVEVELRDGLTVVRSATASSSSKMEFSIPGETVEAYATTSKWQESLETRVGDFAGWYKSCIFTSRSADTFTAATDADRRAVVEELVDLSYLADAHEVAKGRRSLALDELQKLEGNLGAKTLGLASAEANLELAVATLDTIEDPPPLGWSAGWVFELDEELSRVTAHFQECDAQLNAAYRRQTIAAELAGLGVPVVGDDAPDEAEIERLRGEWGQLGELITGFLADISEVKSDLKASGSDIAGAQAELAQAEKRADLLDRDACPTCQQPIAQELRARLQQEVVELRTRLSAIQAAAEAHRDELESAEGELHAELDQLRQRQHQIQAEGQRLKAMLEDHRAKAKAVEAATRRRSELADELDALGPPLAVGVLDLEQTRRDAQAQAEKLRHTRAVRQAEERHHAARVAEVARMRGDWTQRCEAARSEIAELQQVVEDLRGQVEAAREVADVAVDGVKILEPKGVRAHILGRALEALETIANQWLQRFTGELKLELRPYTEGVKGTKNAIALRIQGRASGDDYADLSGGEQRVVDLAVVLAMSEVSRLARGVTSWGVLFLDEILDAVDSARSERVCAAVQELARDRSVVVISHSPAVRDRLQPTQIVEL